MKNFEIHITGEKSILTYSDMKTIGVRLLRPDLSVIRTEYMTSHRAKFESYRECKDFVDFHVKRIEKISPIVRVKIETPYYEEYVKDSLYMESHFRTNDNKYALSQNEKKDYMLGTDRTYNPNQYCEFKNLWYNAEVELCVFDSFPQEDEDWLNLWKK